MLVAATGDVHHPSYTYLLESSLASLTVRPDLFLIAGDILKPGPPAEYAEVVSVITSHLSCPIIATFGNTEFQEDREEIRKENPDVTFLDDEAVNLEVGGKDVLIVGSTGSLERPTSWQKRNIPHISDIYRARVETISRLLGRPGDAKILLTHYATTYRTLEGESRSSFPWMGTRRFEPVILQRRPTVVVHAHAHAGTSEAELEGIPIYNVSIPLNREIVIFDLESGRRVRPSERDAPDPQNAAGDQSKR